MYCPNCGAKTSIEQKFCRTCGLGLAKIASELGEQLPLNVDDNSLSEKERLERIGVAALSVFASGLFAMFVYFIVYKMMVVEGRVWGALALIGLAIMMGFGLLAAILFAKAKDAEDMAGKRKIKGAAKAVATPTKELLTEGNFEPVPVSSVTDRTTELLYAEKGETKRG